MAWYQLAGMTITAISIAAIALLALKTRKGGVGAVGFLWIGLSVYFAGDIVRAIYGINFGEASLFAQIFATGLALYLTAGIFLLAIFADDEAMAFGEWFTPSESFLIIPEGMMFAPAVALLLAPIALVWSLLEGASLTWLPLIGEWSVWVAAPAVIVACTLLLLVMVTSYTIYSLKTEKI